MSYHQVTKEMSNVFDLRLQMVRMAEEQGQEDLLGPRPLSASFHLGCSILQWPSPEKSLVPPAELYLEKELKSSHQMAQSTPKKLG